MPKYSKTKREAARRLYLTGEAASAAEIAKRLKLKSHTVGQWRRDEDWDALRLKIDRQAAEKLVEQLANERVSLNAQHFKLWNVVITRLFSNAQNGPDAETVRLIERMAAILDRAQKGQRLARGLSLDGQTEEQIRAQAEADGRALIDTFIDVVKAEVEDESIRDRISRALMDRCTHEAVHEDEPAA